MADDEERRRVAERLRTYAKTVSHSPEYLWMRLETAVNGWRYGAVVDESYAFDNDVLSRLADLIDPASGDVEGRGDALAVEALEYIYALESALVQLSSEGERKKIVSLMCAVRERFAPRLSEKLYDWTRDEVADD